MSTRDEILIRHATEADAEALADLARRTFHDTFVADNTPEDMAAFLAATYTPDRQRGELADPTITTLLAIHDGVPIAFAQIRVGEPPTCITTDQPVEIWRFYVDAPWHGQGLAHRLMAAVFAEAATLGAQSVWLGVWERNFRAQAFYRKFDFVPVGAHDFLVGQDLQTDILLVRDQVPA